MNGHFCKLLPSTYAILLAQATTIPELCACTCNAPCNRLLLPPPLLRLSLRRVMTRGVPPQQQLR